jgi:hypothetical protein
MTGGACLLEYQLVRGGIVSLELRDVRVGRPSLQLCGSTSAASSLTSRSACRIGYAGSAPFSFSPH